MQATTPGENKTLRVEVGRAELLGAAIGAGIIGFIFCLLLFYFKQGVDNWLHLIGLSALGGVFTGFLALRKGGGKKQKAVMINANGIQIENEKNRICLTWEEIDRVNHWFHSMDYWEFCSSHRSEPVVLKGHGFSRDQCQNITEAIGNWKPVHEEELGMKRMLQDAYVH